VSIVAEKKILMVIPTGGFRDEEYQWFRRACEARGFKVTVASTHLGVIRGLEGVAVKPDLLLDDVKYYDYDAIVFIGGEGARRYFDHEKALKLAKDAKYKVLGATGNASVILANAGVLEGKRATAPSEVAGFLVAKGANFTGRPMEIDDKLVTTNGSLSVEYFANALIELLKG